MNRRKTGLLFVVVSVLTLLMVSACGMLFEGLEKGYNLVLTVQRQSPGRAVTVDYHDVTRLEMEVRRTETSGILQQFSWAPGDDDNRFIVNLGATGEYVLKVTHFYKGGGVEKPAEEWAKFKIKSYIITMINIMPGAVGAIEILPPSDPIDDLQGLWYGSEVPFWDDDHATIDIYTWIGPDNRYRTVLYPVDSTDVSERLEFTNFGSFSAVDGVFHPDWEAVYAEGAWQTPETYTFDTFDSEYTCNDEVFILVQDLSDWDMGTFDWEMTKVESFCDPTGNWSSTDVLSPNGTSNADLNLFVDGTYEVYMYHVDPVYELLSFSTTGYWWIADGEVVLDAVLIYTSNVDPVGFDWYPVSVEEGVGWNSPYQCVDGKLTLEFDFDNDGTYDGAWVLDPVM
jgi:hypothetical protein